MVDKNIYFEGMKNTLIGSHKNKKIKIFGDFWLSLPYLVMPLSLSVRVNTKLVFSLTPGLLLRDNLLHVSQGTSHVCHVSVPVCPDAPVRLAEVDHVPGQREVRVVRVGVAGQQLGAASKYFLVLQIFSQDATNIFSNLCWPAVLVPTMQT